MTERSASPHAGRRLAVAGTCGLALAVAVGGAAVAVTRGSDPDGRPAATAAAAGSASVATGRPANAALPTPSPTVVPSQATTAPPSAQGGAQTTSRGPATVHVPKLHGLTQPDVVVRLPAAASHHAVSRLRHRTGIQAVAVLDRGTIRLDHRRYHVAGVHIADIRGFTPKLTAVSTKLWRSVARGELTVAYGDNRRLTHRLGDTLPVRGRHGAGSRLRVGAFATLGLQGVQALVDSSRSSSVGLRRGREVLVAAPKISLDDLRADVVGTLGHRAALTVTRPVPFDQSVSSTYARSTIPTSYLDLYRRAAVTCPGLPWTVLAAIGTVETGNGRNVHRSTAGAEGPMQFLPSTWAMYGTDANGDGKADIQDPTDAVFSAAKYLCAAGAGRGGQSLAQAIFSYNHAWWYVREVILIANRYA